jgi:hypothetical protein
MKPENRGTRREGTVVTGASVLRFASLFYALPSTRHAVSWMVSRLLQRIVTQLHSPRGDANVRTP